MQEAESEEADRFLFTLPALPKRGGKADVFQTNRHI
jgi:hypothetical protein